MSHFVSLRPVQWQLPGILWCFCFLCSGVGVVIGNWGHVVSAGVALSAGVVAVFVVCFLLLLTAGHVGLAEGPRLVQFLPGWIARLWVHARVLWKDVRVL